MGKILVITGAGVSADSGIDTFRGGDKSLYTDPDVMSLISSYGLSYRKSELYDWINNFKEKYKSAKPNQFHEYLATLNDAVIFTQNVDGLHNDAGSELVYELHGNVKYYIDIVNGEKIPCSGNYALDAVSPSGGPLRPNVVLFGEYPNYVGELIDGISHSEIIIIAGTGLDITYLSDCLGSYHKKGQKVVIVNPDIDKNSIKNLFKNISVEDLFFIETKSIDSINELNTILG